MRTVISLCFLVTMFQCLKEGTTQSNVGGCPTNSLPQPLVSYDRCLRRVLDRLLTSNTPPQSLATYLQRMCDNEANPMVDRCQQELERMLSFCLDDNQRSMLQVLKRANKNAVIYLCQNSGNRLKEFRESDGLQCLSGTLQRQTYCINNHPLLTMYEPRYEGNFCTYQQPQGMVCLKDAIGGSGQCSQSSADYLIGYYQTMVDATPCEGVATVAHALVVFALVTLTTVHSLF